MKRGICMLTILLKFILIVILLLLIFYICYKCHKIILFKKETKSTILPSDSISIPQTTDINTVPTPIPQNENPIKAPELFTLKTFFESSRAERLIYEYLQKELSSYYIVIPHVSLTDIFAYPQETDENNQYNIYKLLGYHVDFAIYDKLYHPVMAIESNGGSHKTNTRTMWTDQRKKELFDHFKIPLITLDLSKSYKDNDLIQLLKNEIKEDSRIVYCWHCHVPITYPFAECPKCNRNKIPVKPLFSQQH